jgi:hypothetical protein
MSDTLVAYDEDGTSYTIHVHRSFINTDNLSGRGQPIEGLRAYRLSTGGAVNQVDARTFVIASSRTILKVKD